MGRYLLTPVAKSALVDIGRYIRERGSPEAAKRVGKELRQAMRKLADMPGMGHLRDDVADESLRFWPIYSYLIVYRPSTKPLQIIHILHGARDIAKILERDIGG